MKKSLYASLLGILFMAAAAYGEPVFSNGVYVSGGYGGPEVRWNTVDGKNMITFGLSGAWVINEQILLGGAGFGGKMPYVLNSQDGELSIGYGGLRVGALWLGDTPLNITVSALIGAGALTFDAAGASDISSAFFILEPEVALMLHIIEFLRIGVGVQYKFLSGLNLQPLSHQDVDGLSVSVGLYFGNLD